MSYKSECFELVSRSLGSFMKIKGFRDLNFPWSIFFYLGGSLSLGYPRGIDESSLRSSTYASVDLTTSVVSLSLAVTIDGCVSSSFEGPLPLLSPTFSYLSALSWR